MRRYEHLSSRSVSSRNLRDVNVVTKLRNAVQFIMKAQLLYVFVLMAALQTTKVRPKLRFTLMMDLNLRDQKVQLLARGCVAAHKTDSVPYQWYADYP